MTLESLASGWGIAAAVRSTIENKKASSESDIVDLLSRCESNLTNLTTKVIAAAAREGNQVARNALDQACRALGWGIAQMVTLLAPEVVVVGGGVSLIDPDLFLNPLRGYARQFVFPPLRDAFELVPASLGESVVVRGAILVAADPARLSGI
jgi:glucokinase